jgi:hypothetical protein
MYASYQLKQSYGTLAALNFAQTVAPSMLCGTNIANTSLKFYVLCTHFIKW